jgi:hypothetical protein
MASVDMASVEMASAAQSAAPAISFVIVLSMVSSL